MAERDEARAEGFSEAALAVEQSVEIDKLSKPCWMPVAAAAGDAAASGAGCCLISRGLTLCAACLLHPQGAAKPCCCSGCTPLSSSCWRLIEMRPPQTSYR
jgi:hypothetical protein